MLARYRFWFWAILLATFVIFPLVGYQIARHGIRPVEEMATTARHISSTNLRERIRAEGYPFELASLAGTFNQMLDRLEESFERISRFSADIAHDLRTPVNNIRGEAEVPWPAHERSTSTAMCWSLRLEESVRLSELIGDLLFLARAESPLTAFASRARERGRITGHRPRLLRASAADGEFRFWSLMREPLIAELDRSLMLRAVSNLVSNAIAHTPPGGTVTLAATKEGAAIRIEVSDTGVGIPAEALPRVFDRFFRVDPSRSKISGGTGLGLAIVQGILTLHGGSAEITSQPGRGTCVTLRMPELATR